MHATPTARGFFLAHFYFSGPFTCMFSKTSPEFFSVLAVTNASSFVGLQNEIYHPAHRYRQLMQAPIMSTRGI